MNKIKLNFGAITIDNSIFKSEGYKFNEGLLALMHQFKESPVQVIQTDIVHNEAIKHIGQEISKARTSIDQALKSANKQLKIDNKKIDEVKAILSIDGTDEIVAEGRLKKYYECIGAEVIDSAKYTDLALLMRMYFEMEAPFETNKDKKNEFPDAIALLCLEGWADENNINVIAVSQDNGWKNYANDSQRITLVSSLSEALEKFQPHNKVASIISHIRTDFILDEENHVLAEIEYAIKRSINCENIKIDASSSLYFEEEFTSANYIYNELDTDRSGLLKIRIVRIDDGLIVLKIGARVKVEVEVLFNFWTHDYIDKEYISMGSADCRTNEEYHTDLLLTLTGDFSQTYDDLVVDEIEVLDTIRHAYFGEIEPDWKYEYEHEHENENENLTI